MKLAESLVPTPTFPAASVTPVLSTVITFVASEIEAVGSKVAVHTVPPSEELTAVRVPLGIVMSALLNPVTASLKVKVTNEVSPALSALSAKTIETVGTVLSIVIATPVDATEVLGTASHALAVIV